MSTTASAAGFSEDKMAHAISDVMEGGMTTRAAAKLHSVARSTLARRVTMRKTELQLTQDESQFMKNFNPENSKRNQRRQLRALPNNSMSQKMYDREGRLLSTGLDQCDCLTPGCVGCFFACPRCRSCKCGHECRNNRKWTYDCYEIQGTGILINQENNNSSNEGSGN